MLQTELNPTADPRFNREGDWEALQFFSEADRALSPEEYAARHLHKWGCFALHFHRYRDPVLGAWVRRVGELFDHPEELDTVRERLLTADERARIEHEAAAGF